MVAKVTMDQRRRLQAEAGVSDKTVLRWLRDETMQQGTKERLDAAAKKLGIKKSRAG